MNTTLNRTILFLFFLLILIVSGCKVKMSLTGSDEGEAKTVAVQYFPSIASLAKPTLSPTFTESLKDIFLTRSKLELADRSGDLNLEGSITGYNVMPVAIQSGTDQAQLNRLTITVAVKFTNLVDEKKSFETSFSRFADFSSAQTLSTVEDDLIREITDQLVQDIFNKALNNW